MSLGDNVIADGVSSLFKITVKGPLGGGANRNAFLADTLIDQKFQSAVGAQALFSSSMVNTPGTGTDFGLGTAAGTRWTAADGLVFTLNSGLANYNSATGQLALVRTIAASRLTITNPGVVPVTIFITSSDDSYLGSLTVKGPVVVGNATVDGEIGTFQVGTAGAGAVWSLPGGVKNATVTAPGNAIIDAGYVNNWSMTSNFTGSFRAGSIGTFSVTNGNFSGLLSAVTNISSIKISDEISGRVRAGGNLTSFQAGSMNGALVAAAGDLTTANIRGNMTNSWLFAGFDPGDGGYGYVLGETGNVAIDRFATPVGVQEDQATCGSIKSVSVGGSMTASSISAAIDPGADGYIGTSDDRVDGMGYISTVAVKGYITGNSATNQFYGIYSANGMPVVKAHGQPFQKNGNVSYGSVASTAGNLMVTDVEMNTNQFIITFNHGVDTSTIILGDTLNLLVSKDMTFNPATDKVITATDLKSTSGKPWAYDPDEFTLTLTLKTGTWDAKSWGGYYQLTLVADAEGDVSDNRGLLLDGEFVGALPSGDGKAGGDFVYTLIRADMPDNFLDSLASEAVPLVVDSGPMTITSFIDNIADIDVYRFTAEAWQFLSVQYVGPRFWTEQLASFCIFLRDTQGTDNTTTDDTFEAVSRIEFGNSGALFQAVELPESGDYFVAIEWSGTEPGKTYQLKLDLASSDSKLVADLGGKTPNDAPIAYISNTIDQHNNHLGANSPKQLVYVDFDGGTARLYTEYNQSINVSALDLSKLDSNLGGYEDVIINGNGSDVTGIMDNIISIYRDTPASEPLGSLTVARIDLNDASDWANYLAASSGLFFTTDDPATKGLDPTKDFTTVFIGRSDERPFVIPEGRECLASPTKSTSAT